MRIIKENNFSSIFPMQVTCKRVVDKYGFAYGRAADFCGSEIEIDVEDIKKHEWFKYPNYEGVDYGIICPICGKFIVVDNDKLPTKILNNAENVRLNT